MDKICVSCKFCERHTPSTGLCRLGEMLVEVKCSYCDRYIGVKKVDEND